MHRSGSIVGLSANIRMHSSTGVSAGDCIFHVYKGGTSMVTCNVGGNNSGGLKNNYT